MADDKRNASQADIANPAVERDRQMILEAKKKGSGATLGAYTKLSGPGWLQSAMTLGSGSLTGSLYLGVLGGTALMWLQPFAMFLGVIMLSAISYVALSTKERPFEAIKNHVNPVLGWGWIIASLMANLVWSMPQFALGAAAIRQNLLPGILGSQAIGDNLGNGIVCGAIVAVCIAVVWFYDSGGKGVRFFDIMLKVLVGMIVACFFGVVVIMTAKGALDWGRILGGFIPNPGLFMTPADTFAPYIGQVAAEYQPFWNDYIVGQQRNVMITAASAAVGINMTFLLPYSMLRRGWDKDFRGLAIFDLSTGLFIPFILATGCVIIASSQVFHHVPAEGFLGERDKETGALIQPAANLVSPFRGLALNRIKEEFGKDVFAEFEKEEPTEQEKTALKKKQDEAIAALPEADKRMAAMLVRRDAYNLAQSLSPLTGEIFAHYVFGIGVVGMAVSSIIILMLVNGFVLCEILGVPSKGWLYRIGCLMPCVGFLGPFIWTGDTKIWLAIPTSMFGMVLLPIAYFTFFFMMNQKSLLGDNMPRGAKRFAWNFFMLAAAGMASFGCVWSVWSSKFHWYGLGGLGLFILLAVVVHFVRPPKHG